MRFLWTTFAPPNPSAQFVNVLLVVEKHDVRTRHAHTVKVDAGAWAIEEYVVRDIRLRSLRLEPHGRLQWGWGAVGVGE
jgi:hypothetical protein